MMRGANGVSNRQCPIPTENVPTPAQVNWRMSISSALFAGLPELGAFHLKCDEANLIRAGSKISTLGIVICGEREVACRIPLCQVISTSILDDTGATDAVPCCCGSALFASSIRLGA